MDKELQTKLYKKYPELFVQKDLLITQSCLPWGIATGDGWYKIIDNLSKKLTKYAEKKKIKIEATQVKEKFAQLRFYLNYSDDIIDKMVEEAMLESSKTCETCGKPGKLTGRGWVRTSCAKCNKDKAK